MDLSQAMKYVLKNRSANILSDFKKNDLKKISQESFGLLADKRITHPKHALKGLRSMFAGLVHILNGFPGRVKKGFTILKNEFLYELEKMPEQKDKTMFCLKFIGALSRMSLGSIYDLKTLKLGGKSKYTLLQMMLIGICLEAIKMILVRFLDEVEKVMTNSDEIKTIRYIKKMIWTHNPEPEMDWGPSQDNDRVFIMVENFKQFILHGDKAAFFT